MSIFLIRQLLIGLTAPYNRIPDWLFLNANDGSNRRTVEPKFLDGFKNIKAAYRQQIANMYHVSIELWKHEWKFGRTRNGLRTRAAAAGECFHS